MSAPRTRGRRTVAGLALGAAGMLYSRLGGRREKPPQAPEPAPQPRTPEPAVPGETVPTSAEIGRARSELSEELARRAARE